MKNLGLIAVGLVMAISSGVMLSYEWLWFVTPFGAQELPVPHAIGLQWLVTSAVMSLRIGSVPKVDWEGAIAKHITFWLMFFLISLPAHLWMVAR